MWARKRTALVLVFVVSFWSGLSLVDSVERDLHHLPSFVSQLPRSVIILVGIVDAFDLQAHQRVRQLQNFVPFRRHFSSKVPVSVVAQFSCELDAQLEFFVQFGYCVLGIATDSDAIFAKTQGISQRALNFVISNYKLIQQLLYLNPDDLCNKRVHGSVCVNRMNRQRDFKIISPVQPESIFFVLFDDRAVNHVRAFVIQNPSSIVASFVECVSLNQFMSLSYRLPFLTGNPLTGSAKRFSGYASIASPSSYSARMRFWKKSLR